MAIKMMQIIKCAQCPNTILWTPRQTMIGWTECTKGIRCPDCTYKHHRERGWAYASCTLVGLWSLVTLLQDIAGEQRWLAMVHNTWWPAYITVPLAIIGVVLCVLFCLTDYLREKANK